MKKLQGKFALITGSSKGIGAGVAQSFAKEGASVAINFPDVKEELNAIKLSEKLISYGVDAFSVCADVSKESEVKKLIETVMNKFKRIDILVNNAGIAPGMLLEETPTEVFDKVFSINVKGVFLVTKMILPIMYKQNYGKIINTASQHAYSGWPGLSVYTASKGAIISFTRSLAKEVGEKNINVNCVAPGGTKTSLLDNVSDELIQEVIDSIPKKRLAEIDDIVPAFLFLAGDESRHFHGQCLSPNGGDVML